MTLDEIAEAQRQIRALQPCPFCGWVKPDTDTQMMHDPNCPLPNELVRLDILEID